MRGILSLIAFILIPLFTQAQFEYFNSEQFWRKLQLHNINDRMVISPTDTVIIVASNRVIDTSTFRFLPERRSAKGATYYVIYSGGGRWHVHPVKDMRLAVQLLRDKNRDWVVYTEGMGKFFTSDIDRGMNLSAQYGVNVILLDYPSVTASKKRLGNYFFAMHNAKIAYKDFMPVLDTIKLLLQQRMIGNAGINLFFHSMGNIVMRQLIRNGRLNEINENVWVNNLILNAPCVPQAGHKRWVDRIRFAKHIYIHYNPDDFVLGGAYLLSKKQQLGMKVRRPISNNATYINFSTLAGKGHSNFLNLYGREGVPETSISHYRVLFHGDTVNINNRERYRPTAYRGIGYDILP
jgi:hypothetical protein